MGAMPKPCPLWETTLWRPGPLWWALWCYQYFYACGMGSTQVRQWNIDFPWTTAQIHSMYAWQSLCHISLPLALKRMIHRCMYSSTTPIGSLCELVFCFTLEITYCTAFFSMASYNPNLKINGKMPKYLVRNKIPAYMAFFNYPNFPPE